MPSRGHRKNIFNKDFLVTGIGSGPHTLFNHMCCIDYADGYTEAKGNKDKMRKKYEELLD